MWLKDAAHADAAKAWLMFISSPSDQDLEGYGSKAYNGRRRAMTANIAKRAKCASVSRSQRYDRFRDRLARLRKAAMGAKPTGG
jgi:ABC-type Fe3+ transport system substrate-binding protein